MKKAILQFAAISGMLVMLNSESKAQWLTTGNATAATGFLGSTTNFDLSLITNNTSRLYITKTGNVGIGTNTPAFLLDVFSAGNASANFKSSTGTANLIIDRGNSAATSSVSYRTAGVPTWQTGTVGTDNFAIRNIALGNPALTILAANSNVGVGTNAPSSTFAVGVNKFNVAGTDGDLTFSDPLGSITFPSVVGANAPMMQMFASGFSNLDRMVISHSSAAANYGLQYQDATDKFNFIGNGSAVLTADLINLRVGVGTISPIEKLHVVGNALVSGSITSGGDATVGGNLDVNGSTLSLGSIEQLTDAGANTIGSNSDFIPTIDGGNDLGQAGFRWGNVLASNTVGVGVTSAATKLHVDGGSDISPASGGYFTVGAITGPNVGMDNNEIMARNNGLVSPLYIQNSGGDLVLCSASGSVSIGTAAIATGYILSVDGKVMAEEVRVELSQNWPDYVFDNEYKLMSIEALEQHVNEFKHLPGIPSATEIDENGISLGEMQTKTIEKVEENSLYIIQLNNKIDAQNEVIAKLIKELEALKNNK